MIRILIADDHSIVRQGLKTIASLVDDILVVGEAVSGGQVLDCLAEKEVDIIVLDMSMPGVSGVNLIARIRAMSPDLPILVLSMHNEPQIARRALKAGADGYLTKDNEPETLLGAIRKVAAGGRFIDPVLAEHMAFEAGGTGTGFPHEQLSKREFEILRLLAKGKNLNEIADELAISNKTVSTHKMRLMQKMNFNSNTELLRYAIDHSLVE
ncbi:MAG: response regulator transcription factor [Thiobacillus sp.]